MSRIGRMPIVLPPKVTVKVQGRNVAVEGPKGKLAMELPPLTSVKVDAGKVVVSRENETAKGKAMHGLSRALINNCVVGVTEGFSKKLEIQGVGYKAAVQGKVLNLTLGFSHPVLYPIPDSIKITVLENTKLTVEGPDRHLVGQVSSDIRAFYPPEPYKGKGIRYSDEKVERKEGKTVQQ